MLPVVNNSYTITNCEHNCKKIIPYHGATILFVYSIEEKKSALSLYSGAHSAKWMSLNAAVMECECELAWHNLSQDFRVPKSVRGVSDSASHTNHQNQFAGLEVKRFTSPKLSEVRLRLKVLRRQKIILTGSRWT